MGLQARNRLAFWKPTAVSLAFLPPSHKFFFSREIETNLGYVYYRKDSDNSFAIGVRQPDREDGLQAVGISRRSVEAAGRRIARRSG